MARGPANADGWQRQPGGADPGAAGGAARRGAHPRLLDRGSAPTPTSGSPTSATASSALAVAADLFDRFPDGRLRRPDEDPQPGGQRRLLRRGRPVAGRAGDAAARRSPSDERGDSGRGPARRRPGRCRRSTEALIGACFLAFGFDRTARGRGRRLRAADRGRRRDADRLQVGAAGAARAAPRARKLRGDRRIRARRTGAPSKWRRSSIPSRSGGRGAEQEGGRAGGRGAGARERRQSGASEARVAEAGAMYLRSIEMKGFKSFPERERLEFSPGVSVIVGPNGSGKSNITDAVLWALGEQSPGAIRGASMQDVISAGGKGVGRRRAAEVEVVIDNAEGPRRERVLRDRDRAQPRPLRRRRLPAQRRPLPTRRRGRGPLRHQPRPRDALGDQPGPGRGDHPLQAARAAGCWSRRRPASASTASAAGAPS